MSQDATSRKSISFQSFSKSIICDISRDPILIMKASTPKAHVSLQTPYTAPALYIAFIVPPYFFFLEPFSKDLAARLKTAVSASGRKLWLKSLGV